MLTRTTALPRIDPKNSLNIAPDTPIRAATSKFNTTRSLARSTGFQEGKNKNDLLQRVIPEYVNHREDQSVVKYRKVQPHAEEKAHPLALSSKTVPTRKAMDVNRTLRATPEITSVKMSLPCGLRTYLLTGTRTPNR